MRNAHADNPRAAIRRVRGHCFCQRRAAGIRMSQRHHVVAARGHARQQYRRFICLAARTGKKTLLQIPGCDLCNFFCQRHDMFVGIKRRGMLQAIDLRGHFGSHLRIAMAHGHRKDPAKKIEILVSVQVPQVLHLAAVCHQRLLKVVGDRRPQILLMLGYNFLAARFRGA